MIAYLKSLLLIRLELVTRWTKDSCKIVYLMRADRLTPQCTYVAVAAGLTTSDAWTGVRGMLVLGGWADCTGGRKATRPYHFNLIGMERLGSFVRKPYWFWRRWSHFSTWLQYKVDTRYSDRKSVTFTARKVRENSAGNC